MKVYKITNNSFNSNCYCIVNEEEMIVIDPCVDLNTVKRKFKNKIIGVIVTHGHYDHFLKLDDYNEFNIYMHKKCYEKIIDSHKSYASVLASDYKPINVLKPNFLTEGINKIENFVFDVLYTPGHTNCSICLIFGDYMFTGDTLFRQSIGRTDLYSGNDTKMNETILKLNKLKNNYVVYPGHGMETTLEDEKEKNIYMKR